MELLMNYFFNIQTYLLQCTSISVGSFKIQGKYRGFDATKLAMLIQERAIRQPNASNSLK